MWRLFYPLRYFRLVNDEKRHIDIFPTLVLALLITVPFVVLQDAPFFHKDGFLDKLLGLTSALTGFYVAALVAAATFSHPDLDKVFKAGPIALVSRDADGNRVAEHLTRREFVCTVFGYLAFSSLTISLFASLSIGLSGFNHASVAAWPYVGRFIGGEYLVYTRAVVIFIFAAAIAHMAVVTSLGLYYLMDRLYRRDREIVTPKGALDKPESDAA
jgi:hypothetical protein